MAIILNYDRLLQEQIETRIRKHFGEQATLGLRYGNDFSSLFRLAESHALGGKLIRPMIFLSTLSGFQNPGDTTVEYQLSETHLDLAAGLELLHYSFLLHDDVIDGDIQRRHSPNLIGSLQSIAPPKAINSTGRDHIDTGHRSLDFGPAAAILLGDLLLARVHQIFARADLPATTRLAILDLLDYTITETVAGEFADVSFSKGLSVPDLREILAMSRHKTATYTFELPLTLAATVAGAGDHAQQPLKDFSRHLGLAYQLQDDLFSINGDAAVHGKDICSDIREGKETAVVAFARITSAWKTIEPLFGQSEMSAKDAAAIKSALRSSGAIEFADGLIKEHLGIAHSAISRAEENALLPVAVCTTLNEIRQQIVGRES